MYACMIIKLMHIGSKDSRAYTYISLEQFYHFEVPQTCELRKFVEQQLGKYEKGHAYFQFTCATEDIENYKEVLLMDKVKFIQLYS